MPATEQDAGGCGCAATHCNVTFNVHGCNGLNLANATVTVSRGGTTVATGTTDASGNVTLDVVSTSSATLVVSKSRFVTSTTTTGPLPCGTNYGSILLNPASGFICNSVCADPDPLTLHLTDTFTGPATLTWNVGTFTWRGTNVFSCPAIGSCPAVSLTILWEMGTNLILDSYYNSVPFTFCPDDSGANSFNAHWGGFPPPTYGTCLPLNVSSTYSYPGGGGSSWLPNIWAALLGPAGSNTITITE